MRGNTLRDSLIVFAQETGLAIDPDSDVFGLEIEGTGEVDVAIAADGQSLLLRAGLVRALPDDPLLLRALEANARPAELGGAALGYDAEEASIVLSRIVPAVQCGADGLAVILAGFAAAMSAASGLLQHARSPDRELPHDDDLVWLKS